ncbi:uricase [Tilletiaria anomala UBC 951]|uniref:Uricase n=1 Tax=Tilletiaria anomala (strain ATCC 24038 / CBS 436.72 / UBC 951) TaxID=1037660 RepID=A0A066V9P6_TILAU|nr:uricase [Tilletiaria anomala UBC 951]KDN37013.1 uricase [Tilletiaria anomala UBC 951]
MVHLVASSYGKDLVRILRVVRSPEEPQHHNVVEYNVRCLLSGAAFAPSYIRADNSPVVATDSIKNTLNVIAKRLPGSDVLCPERYALHVAQHFLSTYKHVEGVELDIQMLKWSRIALDGKPHGHSFVRDGDEKRLVRLLAERDPQDGKLRVKEFRSGLKDLLVFKSTGSAFHGFWRDEYTTLKEVHDRIFSTSIECWYTLGLPAKPISTLLQTPEAVPDFCTLYRAVTAHTLRIFATDVSASVQATLYRMCETILNDVSAKEEKAKCGMWIKDVEYSLPNKHYIPIDLSFMGLKNTDEKDAEVFLPSQHPSGLIKAKVARDASKL